jgi:hypothetical protein
MQSRHIPGEVRHRAADADARVVLPELDRVVTGDDPVVGPVQACLPGALLVAHPVAVRVPERAFLEDHDLPAAARKPLCEDAPAGARPDHREIDDVVVAIPSHPIEVLQAALVWMEQKGRIVLGREPAQSSPHFFASRTGS